MLGRRERNGVTSEVIERKGRKEGSGGGGRFMERTGREKVEWAVVRWGDRGKGKERKWRR